MARKHRFLAVLLALALLLGMTAMPAAASSGGNILVSARLSAKDKADYLYGKGLFKGTGFEADGVTPKYDLDDKADRAAAATMLIRLLGKENKAKAQYAAGALPATPFTDLSWERETVTWLYSNNLANGETNTTYGGKSPIKARDFATFILRALGYSDSGSNPDFNYNQALDFAVKKEILTQTQSDAYQKDFRRDGMVEMCYNALFLTMNDSSLTLLEKLENDGVFKTSYNTSVAGTPTLTLTEKYKGAGFDGLWWPEEQTEGNSVCCADIDGDGNLEIIFGVQSVFCVNAADGKLKWKIPSSELGGGYARNGIVPFQILDWDGDGSNEIFTVTFTDPYGYVNIIDGRGNIEKHFVVGSGTYGRNIHAVHPADLDGDGKYEMIVGVGVGDSGAPAVYVYNNDGALRSGWPQVLGYGLYSSSITTADLDKDGVQEIILTYDETQIAAFRANGAKVEAAAFGATWDKVDFFANYDTVGYNASNLTTSDFRNGIMGTRSGLVVDDLDNDGKKEIIGVAMINDTLVTYENMNGGATVNSFIGSVQYFAPFIINLDRTRYQNASKGFDWRRIPADTGATLYTLGTEVLSTGAEIHAFDDPVYRPVTADLDGDGYKEIIYTANDGKVHCYSLDGTEHGAWPFALNGRTTAIPNGVKYASRPVVADVNGDGKQEVIFVTYGTRTPSNERGKLYVLDYTGKVLAEKMLPASYLDTAAIDDIYANGSSATPIVADIDRDNKMEIVVATFSCGLVAYEIG